MHTTYPFILIISLLWIGIGLFWLFSAASAKKNRSANSRAWIVRLLFVVAILAFFNSHAVDQVGGYHFTTSASAATVFSIIGIILAAAGVGLAIWARVNLGRNWGMPMSLKENPELVTSGPYEYIRNPIYSGIILASIGSMLVEGVTWLLPLAIFVIYFTYSSKAEEKIMLKEFPNQYPEYKKRTKMLIPFIF